mgnify:CR=1 FL=1
MNNEKLVETINSEKEILSTLPKNNKKNISKYIDTLTKYKNDYFKMGALYKHEIERRRNSIVNKVSVNKDLDNYKNKVLNLKNNIYLFNDYNSSYEKSGLDKILYNLSYKGNKNLIDLNNDIKKCLDIFKKVGVLLNDSDFKYAPSAYLYMQDYFKYLDNLNDDNLKSSFEKIYWRFPDIIIHIELSFKYLYYKNVKYFDKYYSDWKQYSEYFLLSQSRANHSLDFLRDDKHFLYGLFVSQDF